MAKRGGVNSHRRALPADFLNSVFFPYCASLEKMFVGNGTYGSVYLFRGESPFVDDRGQTVTEFTVKLSPVGNDLDENQDHISIDDYLGARKPVQQSSVATVTNEMVNQLQVYKDGMMCGVQVCPSILYCTTLTDLQIYRNLKLQVYNPSRDNSMIIMEKFEKWRDGSPQLQDRIKRSARFLLFFMGCLGFTHGDMSLANIMKKKDSDDAVLIDFGDVKPMVEHLRNRLREIWARQVVREGDSFRFRAECSSEEQEFIQDVLGVGWPTTHGLGTKPNMENWAWFTHEPFVVGDAPLFCGFRQPEFNFQHPNTTRSAQCFTAPRTAAPAAPAPAPAPAVTSFISPRHKATKRKRKHGYIKSFHKAIKVDSVENIG